MELSPRPSFACGPFLLLLLLGLGAKDGALGFSLRQQSQEAAQLSACQNLALLFIQHHHVSAEAARVNQAKEYISLMPSILQQELEMYEAVKEVYQATRQTVLDHLSKNPDFATVKSCVDGQACSTTAWASGCSHCVPDADGLLPVSCSATFNSFQVKNKGTSRFGSHDDDDDHHSSHHGHHDDDDGDHHHGHHGDDDHHHGEHDDDDHHHGEHHNGHHGSHHGSGEHYGSSEEEEGEPSGEHYGSSEEEETESFSGEATADTAAADQTTADTAAADQTTADTAAADQTTADTAAADQTTADTAAADQTTADTAAADQTTADTAAADQTAADTVAAEQTTDAATADQTTADTASTD